MLFRMRILPILIATVAALLAGGPVPLIAAEHTKDSLDTVKARLKAPYPNPAPQFVTVKVWLRTTGP